MIKATSVARDGVPVLMLGLSEANLTRLRAGDPIKLDTAPLGLEPLHVYILWGPSEEQIEAQLTELFGSPGKRIPPPPTV